MITQLPAWSGAARHKYAWFQDYRSPAPASSRRAWGHQIKQKFIEHYAMPLRYFRQNIFHFFLLG